MSRNLFPALAAAACAVLMHSAIGQTYPAKPIRFIMPYSPGGSSEILARPIANEMTKSLGQSVVIGHIPGAQFSDGAKKAVEKAKETLFRPDWKKVFETQAVDESVHMIVG